MPIIFSLFDNYSLVTKIVNDLQFEIGDIILRAFPDEETYIKINSDLNDREVIFFTSLDRPNQKILPMLFFAKTAKFLGAKRVGLCAPYLAYMRQDKQFNPGEGITSEYFAELVSRHFDWLVTVDPHLHRRHDLNEIYSIPNTVLHAAAEISKWILAEVQNPILIGPDSESEQWVRDVAQMAKAPYLILQKIRHGDKNVEESLISQKQIADHTPVLIDDIISTGKTMEQTLQQLKQLKVNAPVCIGVHGVFSGDAYQTLQEAGAGRIVTCNTIAHSSNQIDLSSIIINGIKAQLGRNKYEA